MMGYVYFITDGKLIKIGYSKNPKKRIKSLNTGNGNKLYLLGFVEGSMDFEKYLHSKFKRVNGEWFEPTSELLEYMNSSFENRYIDWLGAKLHVFNTMKI